MHKVMPCINGLLSGCVQPWPYRCLCSFSSVAVPLPGFASGIHPSVLHYFTCPCKQQQLACANNNNSKQQQVACAKKTRDVGDWVTCFNPLTYGEADQTLVAVRITDEVRQPTPLPCVEAASHPQWHLCSGQWRGGRVDLQLRLPSDLHGPPQQVRAQQHARMCCAMCVGGGCVCVYVCVVEMSKLTRLAHLGPPRRNVHWMAAESAAVRCRVSLAGVFVCVYVCVVLK